MKKTNENAQASGIALAFVQETTKAIDKAKDLLRYHNNDFKAAGKDLLNACKETYVGFKSNGPKGTPGLLVYNACRKQLDLLKKADAPKTGDKPYDAQARFDSIMKECGAHDDLMALFVAKFAPAPKTRAKAKK